MKIALQTATPQHNPTLARLLQLLFYDLSVLDGHDVDLYGRFRVPALDPFLAQPQHAAFLVTVEQHLAGFALIGAHSMLQPDFGGRSVEALFVLRKYRRQGVGRAVATQLFDTFPGAWETALFATNIPALAFWRSVLTQYTGGRYTERWLQTEEWRGLVQSFSSPP